MTNLSQLSTFGHLVTLARFTTWRVGGVANQVYKPVNIEELSCFLSQLAKDEKLLWVGLGSNLLIRDGGFPGTVIVTQGKLKEFAVMPDNIVRAEAGVACASFARTCARHNLTDMEFMAGIPGTIGGALQMNAGCFNSETWKHVIAVETINREGAITKRTPSEFTVAYRSVRGPLDEWFVAGYFQLTPGDKTQSLDTIKTLLQQRSDTQPTGELNCGSVFRNPPGDYAARLIEACDLKGEQIGGACVSEKHANFIINTGTATAKDIESLIEHVAKTVEQKHGIILEKEVKIVGIE